MFGWLEDPEAVADEYAEEAALRERVLAHEELLEGSNDAEVVRSRVFAARPRRLLEVGSGVGDFCAWARENLDAEIVAVDSSQRMVDLALAIGVAAIRADMRKLPFRDRSFDCAVANFVLYHVGDPPKAIAEIARVLNTNGFLVTSTSSDNTEARRRAWAELFETELPPAAPPLSFSRENGRRLLLQEFRNVDQVDCDAALVFHTRDRLARYVESLPPMHGLGAKVPELAEPFRLPTKTTVFIAARRHV